MITASSKTRINNNGKADKLLLILILLFHLAVTDTAADESPAGGGESLNRKELLKMAEPMAEAALRQSEGAARCVYAGFHPVECSGKIPHVVYNLEAMTTMFDYQTRYLPNRYNEKRDIFKKNREAKEAKDAAAAPAKGSHGMKGFSQPIHVSGPTLGGGSQTKLMKITGSTPVATANNGPDGTTTEWTYSGEEVTEEISDGKPAYETVENGLTLDNKLFNRCEDENSSVGSGDVFGNGVKYSDLSDSVFDGYLKSAPIGAVVEIEVLTDAKGNQYGSFWFPNAIGGECE